MGAFAKTKECGKCDATRLQVALESKPERRELLPARGLGNGSNDQENRKNNLSKRSGLLRSDTSPSFPLKERG
ncbi:hypothetical protein MRB53_030299 [Persea americana]|uniref:Uncharacterized protein n=1 Tax=Persea americana TaxID=3435 RepID=A0ACC2KKS4_PERAE|nr:hypothetical protein MRB53_030299 [Persea americana]